MELITKYQNRIKPGMLPTEVDAIWAEYEKEKAELSNKKPVKKAERKAERTEEE